MLVALLTVFGKIRVSSEEQGMNAWLGMLVTLPCTSIRFKDLQSANCFSFNLVMLGGRTISSIEVPMIACVPKSVKLSGNLISFNFSQS